jgi:hypothetical protein
MRIPAIIASLALLVTTPAWGRTVEPGAVSVAGFLGPDLRLGSDLSAGRTYLLFAGQGEYDVTSQLGVVADLSLGLGSIKALRFHVGGRYRLTQLDLPLSPYAQLQLSVGKLYGVLGADLRFLGVRAGVGADYFLTRNFGAGAMLAADLGSTTGERPAFFGTIDVLVYASYTF